MPTFRLLLLMIMTLPLCRLAHAEDRPPNFILIYCDDLGYSDLGCFGSTKIATLNLDRMAEQGMKLTSFYSTCSVCSPSRSSLMTGSYPRRVNLHVNSQNLCVLFPADRKGLNPKEVTIADALKTKDYATLCVGKWHLGDQQDFLPTQQGFDEYFGIPYSNDMRRKGIPLPLVEGTKVIESPANQNTLTQRYTERVVKFIKQKKEQPFFVYLPHTFPHLPLFASNRFKGKSKGGRYGDTVEEIDWSMGEIFKALKEAGVDDNTMVVFTSDNGSRNPGSNFPLRGRKGQTWEGGMRVPCIVRWPGKVAANTTSDQVMVTFDMLPTFAKIAGVKLSDAITIDGKDVSPILFGEKGATSPHKAFYYYQMDQLQAVRSGKWKLHVALESKKRNWGKPEGKVSLALYDLDADISESKDVSSEHGQVVSQLLALANKARAELGDNGKPGTGQREAGWVENGVPLLKAKAK
jgi:arylsulfatase A